MDMQAFELEHVACDLCGCSEYRLRYRKPDNFLWVNQFEYPVVECDGCGLVYVNPRPTREAIGLFYPDHYFSSRGSDEHLRRYAVQAGYLGDEADLRGSRLLDVGCARGDFLAFLKSRVPSISACGVDPHCAAMLECAGIDLYSGRLEECGFEDGSFDIMTGWAVMEHVHEPSAYFREANRLLRRGGRFLVQVTNSRSLYGRCAYREDVPRHLYHFSRKSLAGYAGRYGFSVKSICYDDDIFDGRGTGTFYYALTNLAGMTWERRRLGEWNVVQKAAARAGGLIDDFVFATHWEAALRISGNIVAELVKE